MVMKAYNEKEERGKVKHPLAPQQPTVVPVEDLRRGPAKKLKELPSKKIKTPQDYKNESFLKMFQNSKWDKEFKKKFGDKVKSDPEFLTQAANGYQSRKIMRCATLNLMMSANEFDFDLNLPSRAFRAFHSNRSKT